MKQFFILLMLVSTDLFAGRFCIMKYTPNTNPSCPQGNIATNFFTNNTRYIACCVNLNGANAPSPSQCLFPRPNPSGHHKAFKNMNECKNAVQSSSISTSGPTSTGTTSHTSTLTCGSKAPCSEIQDQSTCNSTNSCNWSVNRSGVGVCCGGY